MADKNIPGIYNYCDRWCERCAFCSRCAVYESESDATPEESDIQNKAFRERLAINFTKAREMLEEVARERGIDLHTIAQETTDHEEKKKRKKEESKSHPLAKLSMEYLTIAKKWVASQPGMKEKLESFQQQLELDPDSFKAVKATTESIQECLSVIQWYEMFIHVKFVRALMGKSMSEEDTTDYRDYDGSAKIAIIGIERSMQAWIELYELLPDQEDDFLQILALLEQLKTMAMTEFPNAITFKRPGFDD